MWTAYDVQPGSHYEPLAIELRDVHIDIRSPKESEHMDGL